MSRVIMILFFAAFAWMSYGQEPLQHEKRTYTSPDGKLYINKSLPVYIWLSTSKEATSHMYRLQSEETKKYSNPMYFDTEGYNTVRSPSAVDPETRNTVYPLQDIIFEVYADGIPPRTSIDYGDTKLYPEEGKIHLGNGTLITFKASDETSGVENIYYSLDGKPFQAYSDPLKIEQEKEYSLKYYAADNVGNVEELHEQTLILDVNAPVSKLEIEGDEHNHTISGRSSLVITAEDKLVGVKTIYYTIDKGIEKIYKTPLPAAYLSQDEHIIEYYSVDRVGNKEALKTYNFYVDKTPPTIIEEVIGKSFFSGGQEFSSGKAQLKLTSFDNKAGVKEIRYSVNGGEYLLYDKPVFLTQSSGNLLIKSYAVDFVNNRSNSQTANEKTKIPYIDLTGPRIGYSFQGPEFKTRDTLFICSTTKIKLTGSDSEAGMHHISYTIGGGNPMDYDQAFSIMEEGYSEIEFTGYDNVDNTSRDKFGVKVDNTGPDVSTAFGTGILRKEKGVPVYPSHTVLFLTATDDVVGFKNITYSLNGNAEKVSTGMLSQLPFGMNKVKIKAFDQLGNLTESGIEFIIE